MRTRIALSAATVVAALVISITVIFPVGIAGATSRSRSTRHEGRRDVAHTVASGDDWASPIEAFLHARAVLVEREIAAYRKAHPLPTPAPVVTATAVPPAAPAPAPPADTDSASTTTPTWACIRLHESSDRFNTPTVPGGAYGFLEGTWLSLGYSGWAYQAPYAVQSQAALYLYNELGWQPWSTRFVCGL